MTRTCLATARDICRMLLVVVLLVGASVRVLPTSAAEPQPPPEVHALIVGVTDYGVPGEKATKAAEGAKQFASFVATTYGKEAIKHLLLDEKATKANVEKALREIRKVAPGSLVIIYFSGHGSLVQYDVGKVLFLRLHGSSATEVEEKSVEANQLLNCLFYTKYTNAMVFLDCCYAGAERVDIFPESRLSTSGVRAFLMCACSKEETATGDVFTKALLDVWNAQPAAAGGCLRIDDFEDRVKKTVYVAERGYMSPAVTFKTKIMRCVAHLNQEPSALLTFVFPRGCNTGLSFAFDGNVIETGFQCTADYTFVSQISAKKPVKVVIQAPNKVAIADLTIDPREYSPRRVIVVSVSVPDKYALPKESVSAFSAKTYETLANLVADYGDPPQEFYVKAARFSREANPLANTQWLLEQAERYEPTNEVYRLATQHTPLSNVTLEKYAANPWLGKKVIESLELCGANRAASEVALAIAKEIGNRPGGLRGDLLVRAIGNAKCDPSESAREVGKTARGLLAAEKFAEHQQMTLDAIDKSDPDLVASVWRTLPKDRPSWLAWEAHSPPSEKENVVNFVSRGGSSDAKLKTMLAALRLDQLTPAERLDYFSSKLEFIVLVNDGRFEVSRKGTLPSNAYLTYRDVKTVDAMTYTFLAPSLDEWKAFQITKPGFQTEMESDRCWLKRFDEPAGVAGPGATVQFTINGGQKCIASFPTAAKYHTSKPGFAVRPDGKQVFIDLAGEETTGDPYEYAEEIVTDFGPLTLSFKNRTVADKYKKTPEFSKYLDESLHKLRSGMPK